MWTFEVFLLEQSPDNSETLTAFETTLIYLPYSSSYPTRRPCVSVDPREPIVFGWGWNPKETPRQLWDHSNRVRDVSQIRTTMTFMTNPMSFQNAHPAMTFANSAAMGFASQPVHPSNLVAMMGKEKLPPHSSHPAFGRLTLLVFEAVLEVVCVSLPGYIVARQGMFNAEMQKFAANLNVMLFTPCLSMPFTT